MTYIIIMSIILSIISFIGVETTIVIGIFRLNNGSNLYENWFIEDLMMYFYTSLVFSALILISSIIFCLYKESKDLERTD